jgi:hypothetical protein
MDNTIDANTASRTLAVKPTQKIPCTRPTGERVAGIAGKYRCLLVAFRHGR